MPLPDLLDRDVLRALLDPIGLLPVGEAEPVGAEYGFASALARVTVAGPVANGPVVVKAWSVASHGTGEIDFYERWAPRLPVRLAACLGVHADEETGLVVLEALDVARQGDAAEPIAAADAAAIARDLGSIQAATAGSEADLDPVAPLRPGDWHASRREAHLRRHGVPSDPVLRLVVERSDRAETLSDEMLAGSEPGLVHGDVHGDNVVFLADDTPILLDWARPRWGPASHALASLLLGCDPSSYAGIVDAYRRQAPVADREIQAAMLRALVTATLGTAIWQPETPRQHRLVQIGQANAVAAAAWLGDQAPALVAALSG